MRAYAETVRFFLNISLIRSSLSLKRILRVYIIEEYNEINRYS